MTQKNAMLYNSGTRSDWCRFNPRLKCYLRQCPLDDGQLKRLIEIFIYTGRTCRSPRMDIEGTAFRDREWMETRDGFRAHLAMCFEDWQCDDYNEWTISGRLSMNREKCRAWFKAKGKVKRYFPE